MRLGSGGAGVSSTSDYRRESIRSVELAAMRKHFWLLILLFSAAMLLLAASAVVELGGRARSWGQRYRFVRNALANQGVRVLDLPFVEKEKTTWVVSFARKWFDEHAFRRFNLIKILETANPHPNNFDVSLVAGATNLVVEPETFDNAILQQLASLGTLEDVEAPRIALNGETASLLLAKNPLRAASLPKTKLNDKDLEAISRSTTLRSLTFDASYCTAEALPLVSQSDRLVQLEVTGCQDVAELMKDFPVQGLEGLHIDQSSIDAKAIKAITRSIELRSIYLTRCSFTEGGITKLDDAYQVRELVVTGLTLSQRDLQTIANIPHVEDLTIDSVHPTADFSALSACKSLESLAIENGILSAEQLKQIANLPRLKYVRIPTATREDPLMHEAIDALNDEIRNRYGLLSVGPSPFGRTFEEPQQR
jgi:hypothetical protein